MKGNFKASLDHVLAHEGGWADHPKDPGGATMKGVTLKTYRGYYGEHMTKDDLRAIKDDQLWFIYKMGYWDMCRCDDLPAGVDYAVFDAAVNSGPSRSAKWLQYVVGVEADGMIGPKTIEKALAYPPRRIIKSIIAARLNYLVGLSGWPTFGKGWQARLDRVCEVATGMAERSR